MYVKMATLGTHERSGLVSEFRIGLEQRQQDFSGTYLLFDWTVLWYARGTRWSSRSLRKAFEMLTPARTPSGGVGANRRLYARNCRARILPDVTVVLGEVLCAFHDRHRYAGTRRQA